MLSLPMFLYITGAIQPHTCREFRDWPRALRDGVTNVIRPSRARQCTIRLSAENGKPGLEVINNGHSKPNLVTSELRQRPAVGL